MAEPDYAEIKAGARRVWSMGDYSKIEKLTFPASRELIDACAVSAGQEVLDVAAGTGNFALLAAAEGASVVASDLTPKLMERGKERAAAEGCEIDWVEADAEQLPFEDASFDCTASVFGAMFAPRPEFVAKELFRVTRPGNTVGMANWTPDGFSGRMFALWNEYLPRPEGVPPPTHWGVEHVVEERFGALAASLQCERRTVPLEFDSVEVMMDHFAQNGPQVAALQAQGEDRYGEAMDRFRGLIAEFDQAEGDTVSIGSEYLLIVARRRG